MWYVVRCHDGAEEKIIHSCKQHLARNVLDDAFVFTYERMKKKLGQWHTETLQMFPDYVFLETEHEEELSEGLKPYQSIVEILADSDALLRVNPEEEAFLKYLCGKNHHLSMSRGYIRNGITHVVEGPLKGMENRIRKIDRHKRIARIEAPIHYTKAESILAGLEIVEKN